MKKQSLKAALKSQSIVRSLNGLCGCPVGGWAETKQATLALAEELPRPTERSYTLDELISYALRTDHADRYEWRPGRASQSC